MKGKKWQQGNQLDGHRGPMNMNSSPPTPHKVPAKKAKAPNSQFFKGSHLEKLSPMNPELELQVAVLLDSLKPR